jgi:ABC-type antimicrobial peptide transport system permease subunit
MRPQIMPYTQAYNGVDSPETRMSVRAFQLLMGLLLVIVAVNISILIYARTATRTGEIAVRSALGASRLRVITQLFVEALVLSGAAAAIGVFEFATPGPSLDGKRLLLFPCLVAVIVTIGLLAALGPARRGLSVQPTDVLRDE